MLQTVMSAMLTARATLMLEMTKLHKVILKIVREDEVCRRLMTVPGVGAMTSITFKSAVDDPSRIARSRGIGPLFGLTPRKYQSGETDRTGAITRSGDAMVRTELYEAANSVLCPRARRPVARVREPRSQDRRHAPSHVGRGDELPVDARDAVAVGSMIVSATKGQNRAGHEGRSTRVPSPGRWVR